MKYLFIINKGPYGSEEPYNALRLAMTLLKEREASVSIFLMGDAVVNALSGQQTPDGYYNMERYLKGVLAKKNQSQIMWNMYGCPRHYRRHDCKTN